MKKLTINEARAANERLINALNSEAEQKRARTLYRIVPTGQANDWTCNSGEWETLLNTVYPTIEDETIKKAQHIVAT